ncbi:MAG: hypothetical protein AB8B97_13480 [Granulosicoccus sp.]
MYVFNRFIPLLTLVVLVTPVRTLASEQITTDPDTCGFSSSIRFTESAPRDRFTIKNTSTDWHIKRINLDVSTSAGNLIFDVTAEGAGVEVFQPFRSEDGDATLSNQPLVSDGDQAIELIFSTFKPGDQHQFSIDVDDQLSQSELGQIRVSGGEMTGASVTLDIVDLNGKQQSISAVFDNNNLATVDSGNC